MAIFQPSQVVPDVRSGLGLGVIDATDDLVVSWRIQGPSALASFSITIYENDENSTQVYTTGQITTGCPAYGTTSAGVPQFFSYTIPAATLSSAGIVNGKQYKLVIQQWWSNDASVTQSSASVFLTRAKPTLSIAAIGTSGVIDTRFYTFIGNYSQAQGDTLNWFRWRIARADRSETPFFDSGNISGTMNIECYYDGFFPDTDYVVRLNVQTENGVEADTGWTPFRAAYTTTPVAGRVLAGCMSGTDAVMVQWSSVGYIYGNASGEYELENGTVTLPSGSSILWNDDGVGQMNFVAPWSVLWKGVVNQANSTLFTIGQSTGDISLVYQYSDRSLTLKKGNTTLVSQAPVGHDATTLTVILTPTQLLIRAEYIGGGLYPSNTLYPGTTLYPSADDHDLTETYTLSVSYTQTNITSVMISGVQTCDYIEVISGTPDAAVITAAITNGTYVPELTDDTFMLADFTETINADTMSFQGDVIEGFTLYRAGDDGENLTKIVETDTTVEKIYDYSALSQKGVYQYYLFPTGRTTYITNPIVSSGVNPCWWNWTLMECKETADKRIFTVQKAFRFRLNIETSAMVNNNKPSILPNFTRYPTVQLAPQNYKSSSLSGLIGVVDYSNGQPVYVDSTELRDEIYALSVSQNPLFLKSRKGDLFRVRISGDISMQTADATKEQVQTFTIPWVEVGSTDDVSLYSVEYVGVQESEGGFVPQYWTDVSGATAEANDIRRDEIAYNDRGRVVGDAFNIEGHTLILPTSGGSGDVTSRWLNTADATAAPDDIQLGETAYVKGELVTGTADTHIEDHTLYVPDGWISFNGGE